MPAQQALGAGGFARANRADQYVVLVRGIREPPLASERRDAACPSVGAETSESSASSPVMIAVRSCSSTLSHRMSGPLSGARLCDSVCSGAGLLGV